SAPLPKEGADPWHHDGDGAPNVDTRAGSGAPDRRIVGVGVAVDARIVLGIVAAREDAGGRIVGIGALVDALEIAGGLALVGVGGGTPDEPAGLGERGGPRGRDAGHEALSREVGDVVGVLAARLEGALLDRLLEGALELADQPRGRDLERRHDRVADAAR